MKVVRLFVVAWLAVLGSGGVGCLEPNPDRRPQPDMTTPDLATRPPDLVTRPPDMVTPPPDLVTPPPPDMCPNYPAAGGGGKNRPEVLVPSGNGPVGGSGSYPIAAFYLDVFEVTVAAYRECVSGGSCTTPGTSSPCNWTASAGAKEDHPINCITWTQANAFCAWAKPNGRLPTESEWEYAAGGPAGSASKYPWGADEPIQMGAGSQACYGRSDSTCQVAQYQRSLLGSRTCGGVVDLAGGVYEWTSSVYVSTYAHPAGICKMGSSSCSLRGGSWYDGTSDLQAAFRGGYDPSGVLGYIGARCARAP